MLVPYEVVIPIRFPIDKNVSYREGTTTVRRTLQANRWYPLILSKTDCSIPPDNLEPLTPGKIKTVCKRNRFCAFSNGGRFISVQKTPEGKFTTVLCKAVFSEEGLALHITSRKTHQTFTKAKMHGVRLQPTQKAPFIPGFFLESTP